MHFMATALNYMNLGVSMVDRHGRLSFCNDAYLDIHRLTRAEIKPNMPLDEVLSLRAARGTFDEATANFAKDDELTSECVRDLDDGRAVMVSRHRLPGGGWVSTYANFTEQRKLAKQLATTKLFLESVIDNIPVCVAVKDIDEPPLYPRQPGLRTVQPAVARRHRRQHRRRDLYARERARRHRRRQRSDCIGERRCAGWRSSSIAARRSACWRRAAS